MRIIFPIKPHANPLDHLIPLIQVALSLSRMNFVLMDFIVPIIIPRKPVLLGVHVSLQLIALESAQFKDYSAHMKECPIRQKAP
jgi:hypothetical protein